MYKHNVLLFGTAKEAAEELNYVQGATDREMIIALRAALVNALDRIHILEKQTYTLRRHDAKNSPD